MEPFTEDDLNNCWAHYKQYLLDILNDEYDIKCARQDLRSLIGSVFDKRIKKE